MANAPLPDVKEADATGRIAEIYDEIRSTLGVPMVNLIFRNMAAIPGCLEWVWATIGPVYASGTVLHAAERIVAGQSPLPMSLGPSVSAWNADMAAVRATCAAYVRANPANLIGLLTLSLILSETDDGRTARSASSVVGRPIDHPAMSALPPLGDMATLNQQTKELLMALTRQLHGNDGRVIPSFYRHFTAWPRLLDDLRAQVEQLIDTGALHDASSTMQRSAEAMAVEVYRTCPRANLPAPAENLRTTLNELIELFPPNICKMTLIARAMGAALQQR